jgi:hypothetical protein
MARVIFAEKSTAFRLFEKLLITMETKKRSSSSPKCLVTRFYAATGLKNNNIPHFKLEDGGSMFTRNVATHMKVQSHSEPVKSPRTKF